MVHLPLNAADSASVALVGIGLIFLHVGLTQNHSGYVVLAAIEFLLAIAQGVLNRQDIVFS